MDTKLLICFRLCIFSLCIVGIVITHWHMSSARSKGTQFGLFSGVESVCMSPNRYSYDVKNSTTLRGQSFTMDKKPCTEPEYYIDLSTYDMTNFTMMTAASQDHFEETRDLVAGIQEIFPDKMIYYYDIGLSDEQVKQLKTWCHVVYRQVNMTAFPSHVQIDQHTYAFKPLIIQEAMFEFDAIMWMDASIRPVRSRDHSEWINVYNTAKASGGIVQFLATGRDVFQCTTQGMYRLFAGGTSVPLRRTA